MCDKLNIIFTCYQYVGSGELKVNVKDLLPIDKKESMKKSCRNPAGCPIVGDKRGDENIALLAGG